MTTIPWLFWEYEQSANMDSILIEIQQKLDQLEGSFSDSVGKPMIMQIDPDMMPVMVASADVEGMDESGGVFLCGKNFHRHSRAWRVWLR